MTPVTFLAVVLAAVLHATWNLMAKRAAASGVAFVLAYSLVSLVAFAPWSGWLLWQGQVPRSPMAVAALLATGLLHIAYALALQWGYRAAQLSVVYPVARGSGPLLSTLGAVLVLHEHVTLLSGLGLLGVVGGIALIATNGALRAFRGSAAVRGVQWGLFIGGLIAAYTVVDGYAVKELGVPPVVTDAASNVIRVAALAPFALRQPRAMTDGMRGLWGLALGVGVLSSVAYILVLWALSAGAPLHVVAPLREMSMMVGAVLGMAVLGERLGPGRIIGCAMLTGGVVALGMA
jgi:drug/metabolite transporter (DMT)-like permease